MSETQTYKEWLASGDTEGAVVETIEVSHPSWSEPVYLTNWDIDLSCYIEDTDTPGWQTFTSARFGIEPAETNDGTEQRTSIAISAYGGTIYSYFRGMSADDRMVPIVIRPRLYMTGALSTQLVNPSPKWTIHAVTGNFEAVTGDLQIAPLRVHRTGRYYTAFEFPVLPMTR